jgi:predicted YcjX-like family ATPase
MKCNVYTVDGHMETITDADLTYDDFIENLIQDDHGWVCVERGISHIAIQIKHIVRIVELKE